MVGGRPLGRDQPALHGLATLLAQLDRLCRQVDKAGLCQRAQHISPTVTVAAMRLQPVGVVCAQGFDGEDSSGGEEEY